MKGGLDKRPSTLANCCCHLTTPLFTRKSMVKNIYFRFTLGGLTKPPLDLPQSCLICLPKLFTVGVAVNLLFVAYLISPKFVHRLVGYLEEEAVKTYTYCLEVHVHEYMH